MPTKLILTLVIGAPIIGAIFANASGASSGQQVAPAATQQLTERQILVQDCKDEEATRRHCKRKARTESEYKWCQKDNPWAGACAKLLDVASREEVENVTGSL